MKLKSLEEMAEEYKKIYDGYSYKSQVTCDEEGKQWLLSGERYAKEIKIKNPEEVIENLEDKVADLTKQLIEANDTLQDIYGSLAYKVAKRIFIRKKK